MTEPNWAGGWRPVGYRPIPPEAPRPRTANSRGIRAPAVGRVPRGQPSRGQRAALQGLRLVLDGVTRVLVLLMRLSFQLVSACLKLLTPAIGAQGALKRVGRF